MDLLEIKSEPPEEFIHMNKNEILKDEFTGETKEILNQEFLIKCENDENETIIPKIEVGLSENELTDKESINENETILLEQGDRNKMNNPSSEGELSEEDNKTIVHQLIDSDGKIWYDELSEETNISKDLGREPTYGDGNEGIHPKIEEELSEEDDKTIIHELIAADGKIWREEMSCEVTYIPKALPRTSGSQEISYGDQAVYPKIEEELSDEENKTIVHELLAADGKIWTEEMSLELFEKKETVQEVHQFGTNFSTRRHKYSQCHHQSTESYPLERHVEAVHSGIENYKCEQCKYQTYRIEDLEQHINNVHFGIKGYKCCQCDYQASLQEIVKQHTEAVHIGVKCDLQANQKNILKHKCKLCGYQATQNSALKQHVEEAHLVKEEHKSSHCDYQAQQNNALKAHVNSVHLGIKNHKCDICDFQTNRKSTLEMHVEAIHLGLKKHKCTQCDYQTNNKSTLKFHVDCIHLGIKKHKCTECDYQAARKDLVKLHVDRVHLSIKKYLCDVCGYLATQKKLLKLHIDSVHLGIRKHKCTLCNYQATDKSDIKNHADRVHLRIKHGCEQCDYKSLSKELLKRHIKKVHFVKKT